MPAWRTPAPVKRFLVLLLVAAASSGCETTERRQPWAAETPVVVQAAPARAWEIRRDAELLGYMVAFGGDGGDTTLYVVRNAWHQDLGVIDAFGRAYRYLPHHREPAWVGTGTVARGVAGILGLEGECELLETELPPAAEPVTELAGSAPAEERP